MRSHRPRVRRLFVSAFLFALSAGPALAQDTSVTEPFDPFEPVNRKMFAINQAVDNCCLGPAARFYGRVVPHPLRKGLRNFAQNLKEPQVFVNDLLQGKIRTAGRTAGRFIINTTWGVGGVIDLAKRSGIPYHENGFGTTLGKWGANAGPYLFLPVLGPSTMRDTIGGVGNIFMSPQYWASYKGDNVIGPLTLVSDGLDRRFRAQRALDTVKETSTDPYATLRSFYLQTREAAIHGEVNASELPDFDTPDGAPTTPSASGPSVPPLPDIQSEPEPQAEPSPAPTDAAPAPAPTPAAPDASAPPPTPAEPVR